MLKLFINRAPNYAPWGGGAKFVNALYEYVADLDDVKIVSGEKPDVALIVGLDAEGDMPSAGAVVRAASPAGVKTIIRVNENDARKNTNTVDDRLIGLTKLVDHTVFVSDWLRGYFESKWQRTQTSTSVIVNGVDHKVFRPNVKLDNGKVNIVAHHWSNNRMKGFDIYEKIDEFVGEHTGEYSFTYIGRHTGTLKNSRLIEPLKALELGSELGKYDVYVSASRFDPGPNHITEAIACGLPTYVHEDGGGCVEFAGQDHVYSSWEQLKQIIVSREFEPNSHTFGDWETCARQYIDLARRVQCT